MKRLLRFALLAAAVVVLIAGAAAISPNPLFQGEISSPLHPPAKASEYKEGGNFSFLVERAEIHAAVRTG